MLVQPERRALGHGIVFSLSFTLQPNHHDDVIVRPRSR